MLVVDLLSEESYDQAFRALVLSYVREHTEPTGVVSPLLDEETLGYADYYGYIGWMSGLSGDVPFLRKRYRVKEATAKDWVMWIRNGGVFPTWGDGVIVYDQEKCVFRTENWSCNTRKPVDVVPHHIILLVIRYFMEANSHKLSVG